MTILLAQIEQLKSDIHTITVYIEHLKTEYNMLLKIIEAIHHNLFADSLAKFYLHLLPAAHNMAVKETLLYSSARDGFSNAAFEEKVGTNGSLLFMIKSERDRYYGGFLNKSITHALGPVHDDAAFTFSRNVSEVCHLREGMVAYYNSEGYLFVFGDHDIMIHNQTDPSLLHSHTLVNYHPNENYVIPPHYEEYNFYDDGHVGNITSLEVYHIELIKT